MNIYPYACHQIHKRTEKKILLSTPKPWPTFCLFHHHRNIPNPILLQAYITLTSKLDGADFSWIKTPKKQITKLGKERKNRRGKRWRAWPKVTYHPPPFSLLFSFSFFSLGLLLFPWICPSICLSLFSFGQLMSLSFFSPSINWCHTPLSPISLSLSLISITPKLPYLTEGSWWLKGE